MQLVSESIDILIAASEIKIATTEVNNSNGSIRCNNIVIVHQLIVGFDLLKIQLVTKKNICRNY